MIIANITIIPAHFHNVDILEHESDISDVYLPIVSFPVYRSNLTNLRELFNQYEVEHIHIERPAHPNYDQLYDELINALTPRQPRGTVRQLELWPGIHNPS